MESRNFELVTKGMRTLLSALQPFVAKELKKKYGTRWWETGVRNALPETASMSLPSSKSEEEQYRSLDVSALLSVIDNNWREIFGQVLTRDDRSWVKELFMFRNRWAHLGADDMSEDDAWRALDTIKRLLDRVDGSAAGLAQKLAWEVRNLDSSSGTIPIKESLAPPIPLPQGSLKPWRDVIEPRDEVASGEYALAKFAVDLADVIHKRAPLEYQDPVEFFLRTYMTDGMKRLLRTAAERINGKGGEPVIQLRTAFGGGKTHTMLALYHMAGGKVPAQKMNGVQEIFRLAGVQQTKASIAVLVGTALDCTHPRDYDDLRYPVKTLWGEMAYQLGGPSGFEIIRSADEASVAPGADRLAELFETFAPCVILIDELVAYARNIYSHPSLPGGSFDSNMTFVQALTEAAKRVNDCLVVVSIPESGVEIGREGGSESLKRLEHIFKRVEAVWKPVGPQEGFEIVRRRLFKEARDASAREDICRAFSRMYIDAPADFPNECREGSYLQRLIEAYPIHPEIFDTLYNDWGSLETFQRTRGVLRLMAAAIHELWNRGDQSLLIMSGSLPLDSSRVKEELTNYLPGNDAWNTVVDTDVDGHRSDPRRIDEGNPRFGKVLAARRVARTIFLGTAPLARLPQRRGLTDQRIRLGVVQPEEQVATFNDALARLNERLAHLYSDRRQYWYDLPPNLLRTVEDRKNLLDREADVLPEIYRRLRSMSGKTVFGGVHVQGVSEIPDDEIVRLVLLSLDNAYGRVREKGVSPAVEAAEAILAEQGNRQRQYKNMLIFLAADQDALDGLENEARRFLAWRSVCEDADNHRLDLGQQQRQATEAMGSADRVLTQKLKEPYCWLLVPIQDGIQPISWEITRIQASEDEVPAVKAADQLKKDGQVITTWAPALLRMELDKWLWKDQSHIRVKEVWECLARYVYLPRLINAEALLGAVKEGVLMREFAYASAIQEDGRYAGLKFGEPASVVTIDGRSVLIRSDVAQRQKSEEQSGPKTTHPVPAPDPQPGTKVAPAPKPDAPPMRRFYGSLRISPLFIGRDAGKIGEEIVAQLASLPGAEVAVTLEVSVKVKDGVPEKVQQTVKENCRTLKFETYEFEEE